ncbi:CsgG/HfaB family protein [uncultured Oceanisphaera sp.]|uniref:CsgG/HfaB family protein n=1 Tax=uncultured Oceanisphaera sp. TaxID=353858 RepID=UPI0026030E1D|nr:CsgG/HfaB family protein [uncultured Oceanisphaera sp.]
MKTWLLAALLPLCLLAGHARADVTPVQVSGFGVTEQLAVENALVEAVRQVNGVDINSSQQVEQLLHKKNGETESLTHTQRDGRMAAKGMVDSYQMLSQQCDDAGCRVELHVNVLRYKPAGRSADSRRKLAVLPFKGSHGATFSRDLQDLYTQSRRFAVLDREQDQAYQRERQLWESDNTALTEKARMGQVLGLDYMVVGKVEKAGTRRWSESVALTGEVNHYARSALKVRYQIIEVPTRQVKWSDTVSLSAKNGNLNGLINQAVTRIFQESMENIYPLRVIGVTGNRVIINQGGKTLKNGSYFTVYSLGEKLVDPYTGEVLGQDEAAIGKIRITTVKPKMAYARLVEGDAGLVEKGQIVRPAKAPVRKPAPRKSSASKSPPRESTQTAEGGGVIL